MATVVEAPVSGQSWGTDSRRRAMKVEVNGNGTTHTSPPVESAPPSLSPRGGAATAWGKPSRRVRQKKMVY